MSALDDRIRAVVDTAIKQERKRSEAVLAEVLGMMKRQFDQKLERSDATLDRLGSDVRELFSNRPDSSGVIRKQFFTPQPRERGERHG
jgi:hypothetical protein